VNRVYHTCLWTTTPRWNSYVGLCRYELMVDDNPTTTPPPPKEDLVNIVVVSMANGLCDTE
jgi:hypothetical protein